MQMNTTDHAVITGGLTEQQAFKVEMNAMLFRSVIDGIYANKITSPFREIATNARDAMVEAGRGDEPFDIALPSPFRPTFSIRDYGNALTHDEVMGIYSTMFASTKRTSNEAVGMIGLGSKSPFAYTNAFTITVFRDGMKRIYSAFIGDNEVPQIALVTEIESDERSGIEISWAVKPSDVMSYRNAAPLVLFGFDPKPRILNETYEFKVPQPILSGDGWWLYASADVPFRGPQARQGCVLYPLDLTAAGLSGHALGNWPIVIDFPIGQLNVSTSREQLGYDDRTKRNIQQRLETTLERMSSIVQDEIDVQPTFLDACCWLQDMLNTPGGKQGLYSLLQGSMKWQGRRLRTSIELPGMGEDHRLAVFNPNHTEMGVIKASIGHRAIPSYWSVAAKTLRDNAEVYVEFTDCKKAPSRIRTLILENTENRFILWVKATNQAAWDAVHEQFADVKYLNLEAVDPTAAPARGKNAKQSLRFLAPTRSWVRPKSGFNNTGRDVPDPDEGDILYVRQSGQEFETPNGSITYSQGEVFNLIWKCIDNGLLSPGTKVYCVPAKKTELIDLIGMRSFHEVIAEEVAERLQAADLTYYNGDPYSAFGRYAHRLKDKPLPDDLREWRDLVLASIDENSPRKIEEFSSGMKELFNTYCRKELNAALSEIAEQETGADAMRETYPTLFMLLDFYYSNSFEKCFNEYLELLNKCNPSTASLSLPLAA